PLPRRVHGRSLPRGRERGRLPRESRDELLGETMAKSKTRTEHDLLGELKVPAEAYSGGQTARALENFHISGVELRLYPNLIKAFAMVKLAAARANHDCGLLDRKILAGIEAACKEIVD